MYMRHVKFDGSMFIGFGKFAFFFSLRTEHQIIISIILRYHWCWFNIFHMAIINSENSIPQCDFKLPEICDS